MTETNNERDSSELSQRLFYLEKIVRHKFGAQYLDLQALRALSIEAQPQDESISSAANVAPRHRIAVVEEKCSIPTSWTYRHPLVYIFSVAVNCEANMDCRLLR